MNLKHFTGCTQWSFGLKRTQKLLCKIVIGVIGFWCNWCHYREVTEDDLEVAKAKLNIILDEGIDNDILTKAEYHAMCPDGKGPGRLYSNLNVHKEHVHGGNPTSETNHQWK